MRWLAALALGSLLTLVVAGSGQPGESHPAWTVPAAAIVAVAPRPSPRPLVRTGLASTYGPAYSEAWVAIPQGAGWRIRVCGAGGCRTLVTTDTGPTIPGRIVDLPVGAFESVCGAPWTRGLCPVSLVIEGRAK